MPKYSVQVPVTGSIFVSVEAESAEAAKEAAWDKCGFRIVMDNPDDADPHDFETHDRVCYGNVCGAMCREMNVEEE